ncbi:MAG TPA: glycosyl hydrolase family 8 [Candidatus Nanoarchaeia archaeon]|nr:glycosyl hydrolase family 8 [Candidatus Nanoarchaeia archaeon]
MARLPKAKLFVLGGIVLLYIVTGLTLKFLADKGVLEKTPLPDEMAGDFMPVTPRLAAAEAFFTGSIARPDGHVNLYYAKNSTFAQDNATNSEAMSYYLLWTAQGNDKKSFDTALDFVQDRMLHPHGEYMQWRVESNGSIVNDGSNIATDADLRAVRALLIAENQWGDSRYSLMIDSLASGIERMGITHDGLLAPYAGLSGEKPWTAKEVWLSYSDFTVFRELSSRRGEPWTGLYAKMVNKTLDAQIANGLYNSELTQEREYGNGIDGGGYGINSMWIMVRMAESSDPILQASANRSLQFYKKQFEINDELFSLYNSNGDALQPSDTPWVYALVGRAALALGEAEFGEEMVNKLLDMQVNDTASSLYGAFPEGSERDLRVGQFTMQESILTLQEYVRVKGVEI